MHVDIKIKHGITVNGTKVHAVRMRAPTVADTLAADKIGGTPAEKELAIFANLCELSPTDLQGMLLSDYKLLQEAWQGFFD
jgi:hypothetical protein